MMRTGSWGFTAVAVLLAVMVSACGSSAPDTSAAELFKEYTKSTDVKNDRFGSGGTSADRLANFAAYYTPDQLQAELLAASPCRADGCPPSTAVTKAAWDFAGSDERVFERSVLVKHEDGSLELMTLYVARKADKTAALIDSNGQTYTGGLDDFRENNDVLGSDDVMLAPRDISSVPGEGRVVAVSGHTPTNWQPWLIGGIVAVVVLGGGLVVARRLVAGRRAADVG